MRARSICIDASTIMCPFAKFSAVPETGAVRRVARPIDRLEAEMLDEAFVFEFAAEAAGKARARKSSATGFNRRGWHAYKGRPAAPQKPPPPPPKQSPEPAPGAPKPEEPK